MNRFAVPVLLFTALLFGPLRGASGSDQRHDFEREMGPFQGLAFPLSPAMKLATLPLVRDTSPGAARTGRGALRFNYTREERRIPALAAKFNLAGLESLEFDVRAAARTFLAVSAEDIDGAKFHHVKMLNPKQWLHMRIRPSDFKLNNDSPVKKAAFDPRRAKFGFAIVDLSQVARLPKVPNTLWLDNVTVRRADPALYKKDWTLRRDTVIAQTARIEGTWVIEKDAQVTVRSPWIELPARVRVAKGATLRFEGTRVSMPARYNYQYGIRLESGARLETHGTNMEFAMPCGVELLPGACWKATRTTFPMHNLTGTVQPGAELDFDGVKTPGEVVLWPRSKVRLSRVDGILVWLHTNPGARGRIDLPDGAIVPQWRAPVSLGLQVELREARKVMWGLVPSDGNALTVPNAELRAVGLFFQGKEEAVVRGLENGKRYGAEPLLASRMRFQLNGSRVETWNYYTVQRAGLKVQGGTFGEALAFGFSRMSIENATCDGTGGYFGAKAHARVEVRNTRLACRVIAHDDSHLTLIDCRIEGDLIVTDRSKVTLVRCKVSGDKRVAPGATLVER